MDGYFSSSKVGGNISSERRVQGGVWDPQMLLPIWGATNGCAALHHPQATQQVVLVCPGRSPC